MVGLDELSRCSPSSDYPVPSSVCSIPSSASACCRRSLPPKIKFCRLSCIRVGTGSKQ
ncbi:hypothetical protein CRG98_037579, partial [Punica granatum]